MSDELTPEHRELAEEVGLTMQPDPEPTDYPSAHDLLIDLVRKRKEFGLRKYGNVLTAGNGRNHKMDIADELVDALVYLLSDIDEVAIARHEAWRDGYNQGVEDAVNETISHNPYPHPYEATDGRTEDEELDDAIDRKTMREWEAQ